MGRPHIIGRIIVFSVNFSLWLSGILLIVFGSIGVADPSTTVSMLNLIDGVSNVTEIIDVTPYLEGMAIFMIVLGSFLFLLGFNGCHGIMGKSKRSIQIYWILLLSAMLIEIALIIYAAVYPGTTESSIIDDLNQVLPSKTVQYNETTGQLSFNAVDTPSWPDLEFETTCCGSYGKESYEKANKTFFWIIGNNVRSASWPLSCCSLNKAGIIPSNIDDFKNYRECMQSNTNFINKDGCWKTVNQMSYQFSLISIIISSCIIAAQILAVVFAIPMWKNGGE